VQIRVLTLAITLLTSAGASAGAAPTVCPGDCYGDGVVTIDELLIGVDQALTTGPNGVCEAFDTNEDGVVTVAELLAAVRVALEGCPSEPVEFTVALDPQGPALLITPSKALRPDTVYALVLTSAVTDSMGRPLQASEAFRALKGSDEPPGAGPVALFESDRDAPGNPYPDARLVDHDQVHVPDRFALRGLPDTAELATARGVVRAAADRVGAAGLFSTTAPIRIALSAAVDLVTVNADSVRFFVRQNGRLDLAPLLDHLALVGVPRTAVALAVSFPTQQIERDLIAARTCLGRRAASGTLRAVLTDPDPDDDLDIGVFYRGAPELAEFFADNPDVATVVRGLFPAPDFRGPNGVFSELELGCKEPTGGALLDFLLTLPASAGPHRVVILQHGFAGNSSFGLTLANELAREGLAGIAINAVLHGRRGIPLDLITLSPVQVRDAFRQTNVDQMALVHAIRTGIDVDGDGESELDPAGLSYLGVSLGGILGGVFIAVDPFVQTAVLNVAGGRVAFLGDNPGTRPIYSSFLAMQAELDVMSGEFEVFRQRMLELGQQALDPADPLNYARHWHLEPLPGLPPRRVLMQEGIGDELVSNASTEALAAAAGLVADTPMSDPGGVSGLWRIDPPGGHGILGRADVRAQAIRFLASNGTEIVAPAP